MKKQLTRLVIGLLLLSPPAFAADFFDPSIIGGSAEMIRMGNIEGFTNKSYTVFDNPAALYQLNKFSASLFSTSFMDEVDYRNYSFAMRLPRGVIGVGIMTAGVSDIPRTGISFSGVVPEGEDVVDQEGADIFQNGSFAYENMLLKLSYQRSQSRRIHWGISLSRYSTQIDSVKGDGMNIDLGLLVVGDRHDLSLSVANVIPSMKVSYNNGGEEDLPLEVTAGLNRKYMNWDLYGQLKMQTTGGDLTKFFGVRYHPEFLRGLELSAGYKEWYLVKNEEGVVSSGVESNFTFGMGLELGGVYFDYAIEQSDHIAFDMKHYFSVGFAF